MNELETLYPIKSVLSLQGVEIDLSPLKLGELPAVSKALRGASLAMSGGAIDLIGLLTGEQAEGALTALALAARVEREWLDQLGLDDALALAFAVIEANADFFTQRVLPVLTQGMDNLAARIGSMPSSS